MGPQPWGSDGVGGRRRTSVSVIVSSWAPRHVAQGGGGWSHKLPPLLGHHPVKELWASLASGTLIPCRAQILGSGQEGPLETLPLMDESLGLREGKGLAQSHTACCKICMSLAV